MLVHKVHVFTNPQGKFGDVVPVIIDERRKIADSERRALAKKLEAPETVFVNDVRSANISIMHSQGELDFAGVPALGAAWLLAKLQGKPISAMQSRGGNIKVSEDGRLNWIRANLETTPPWNYKQLENATEVEAIKLEQTKAWEHTMVWAWIDKTKGLIRARTFAPDWDIPEAQGNGSGAMMLAAKLNQNIEIKHGQGSIIFAKPAPNNQSDLGGRVAEVSS